MESRRTRHAAGLDDPDVHEDWVERWERRGTVDRRTAQAWRNMMRGWVRFLAVESSTRDGG